MTTAVSSRFRAKLHVQPFTMKGKRVWTIQVPVTTADALKLKGTPNKKSVIIKTFPTKAAAVKGAVALQHSWYIAMEAKSELSIHDVTGEISDARTYPRSSDSHPPRG